MTDYSFTVTYDPATAATDITNFVQFLKVRLTGTGQIRTATITLDSRTGQFITQANSGTTPILDEFDVIQISITDEDSVTFTENFEVDKLRPVDTVQRGTVLDIELLGPEQHLLRFPFVLQSKRRDQALSAFDITNQIIDIYNDEKGSLQPTVSAQDTTANTFPTYTANHYPFTIKPLSVYDGLRIVSDRVGSSVAAGGGGNFWEYGFIRNSANENDLKFFARISGLPDSGVTLDQAIDVNPGEEEGGIESTRATVQCTWGADTFGTNPPEVGQFRDALTAWASMPDYQSGETYPSGSIIRRRNTGPDSVGDEFHYKANKETSSTPPTTEVSNTDWDTYLFGTFVTAEAGASLIYSPWTKGISTYWENSGANPDGTFSNDPPLTSSNYVWDMNKVVYDGTFFRTWVDVRATSPAGISANYQYSGNFHDNFRVLVDGTGTGDFTGFDNDIIEYDDNQGEWKLFRSTSNDEYVCVDDEAAVYKKAAGVWADDSANSEANDAYHPVYNITNVQGHNNKLVNGGAANYGTTSAVQYEFRYDEGDLLAFTARKYYRAGACINLKAPFSPNAFNSATIGEKYGSDATVRQPVTFDTNNMNYSSDGQRGFNHAKADELGPYSGIRFMNNFEWRYQIDGSGSLVREGSIAAKCFMYDKHDNVVTADFIIDFNNKWDEITIPFSSFTNYRARIPFSFGATVANTFLQELEILQRFDYTNIRHIGFQWMGPYEKEGRYSLPFNIGRGLYPGTFDSLADALASSYNIKWKIDAFHFVKPLLSVSPPVTTGRAMFTEFHEEPLIINRYQNDQANLAKLEENQFRYRSYEIHTEGRLNIGLFESFKVTNADIINDTDGAANTVELVAKEIEYTIDHSDGAAGGFMRKLFGIKRLT